MTTKLLEMQMSWAETFKTSGVGFIIVLVVLAVIAVLILAISKGFNAVNIDKAGWRYGFIATDKEGKCTYSEVGKETSGHLSYQVPQGTEKLWLVVMAAPTEYWRTKERWGNEGADTESAQWPYSIKLNGTKINNNI